MNGETRLMGSCFRIAPIFLQALNAGKNRPFPKKNEGFIVHIAAIQVFSALPVFQSIV